jgi:hypothetical protein
MERPTIEWDVADDTNKETTTRIDGCRINEQGFSEAAEIARPTDRHFLGSNHL